MDPKDLVFEGEPASGVVALIAAAADLCRKPLRHAVVSLDLDSSSTAAMTSLDDILERGEDLRLRLECRHPDGVRCESQDLEVEIYRSGKELNLMVGWWEQPERPMLWQGQHPVWMDGTSGQRCAAPQDAAPLEAFTRRLRALLF